jgi:signal transduction histidine kinase
MEHNIARCRVALSLAAIAVAYIDPEEPLLGNWFPITTGHFMIDPRLLAIMAAHLIYSVVVYLGLGRIISMRGVARTTWADVLFGVAIAALTEGVTIPSFFAFAVVAAGLRAGLRQAMVVTAVSLGLYLCLVAVSARGNANIYIMRPVYLAVTGYLVGYLGQQRLHLQEQMRRLEAAEQRHRIARDLHDGYAQALSGITLRLEGTRRLLQEQSVGEAIDDLADLRESVDREYDDLRGYARALAGVEVTARPEETDTMPVLSMRADMSAPLDLAVHALGIAREGIQNVRRHARAKTATVEIRTTDSQVRIDIEDDGVGFAPDVTPWSIASRVREIGGELSIAAGRATGAHLSITLPRG